MITITNYGMEDWNYTVLRFTQNKRGKIRAFEY